MGSTLFINGTVFDGVQLAPEIAAVLVDDGVIIGLLSRSDPMPQADRIVDLEGGLLTPGFTDAHVHAVEGGLERLRCDLSQLSTKDEYLAAITAYAAEFPEREWILGGGWSLGAFPGGTPMAADLDAIVGDRPVFLPNRDHHGAWINSAAMRLLGIDAQTPDPADGYLERDQSGAPTGTLHEGAMALVADHLPPTSDDEMLAALLEGQRYLHSVGVTSWQDAIIGDYAGTSDPGPAYREAAQRGLLSAYVVGALWWDRERGPEQIPDLVQARQQYSVGNFQATTIKVMQDGVPENGTAAMGEPYLDRCGHASHNSGHAFVDPAVLLEAAPLLSREGFQIHIHAIGDAAVTQSLDALEAAGRVEGDAERRHHIAHLQFVKPADQQRFGELNVAANLQMLWACNDDAMAELVVPKVGAERSGWQYPFAAIAAGGATLVAGSDWPVSTPDPWAALHVAVNRVDADTPDAAPLNPAEAIELSAALSAYTWGSAWINHRDDAGQIALGKRADLVVHDRDPFAGPVGAIAQTRVRSTWIAGEPVYIADQIDQPTPPGTV